MADLGAVGVGISYGVKVGYGAEVAGTVRDASNNPVSHVVRAHFRGDGTIAGEAVSNPSTGNYAIGVRYDRSADPLYVVEFDSSGTMNARIFDSV